MMKNEYIWLTAAAWGILLGAFYFGGLWLTARRLPASASPGRLWLISFAARLFPVLLGLWAALKVNSTAFFITLAAFFMVRLIMSRRIAPAHRPNAESKGQGGKRIKGSFDADQSR